MGSGMEDRWVEILWPEPKKPKVKILEVDKIWGDYKLQYKGCVILPKSWVGKKVRVEVIDD